MFALLFDILGFGKAADRQPSYLSPGMSVAIGIMLDKQSLVMMTSPVSGHF